MRKGILSCRLSSTRATPPRPLALLFAMGFAAGCGGPDASTEAQTTDNLVALTACNLNDGTVESSAAIGTCGGKGADKATICHVPKGNPSNAHTLCIGASALAAHLGHHGDHMGACQTEMACPQATSTSDGIAGTSGRASPTTGHGGFTGFGFCAHSKGGSTGTATGGTTGGGTKGATGGSAGMRGTAGASGQVVIP